MTSTTILTEDSAAIVSEDASPFRWGVVLAGAVAAVAVTFFLITLGSGVGLALASPQGAMHGADAVLTLGAIYFLVAQAFGFTVGGYLVGRLIGPEVENDKEEEFRAAAHGIAMWAVAVVAGLALAAFSSILLGAASTARAQSSSYYVDMVFRPAPNTPGVAADKEEAGRILAMDMAGGGNEGDAARVAELVSHDAGLPMMAAVARVTNAETHMRLDADAARKAASIVSLWTAFALLFGAVLAVASAISARWLDDKVSFSLAPRKR